MVGDGEPDAKKLKGEGEPSTEAPLQPDEFFQWVKLKLNEASEEEIADDEIADVLKILRKQRIKSIDALAKFKHMDEHAVDTMSRWDIPGLWACILLQEASGITQVVEASTDPSKLKLLKLDELKGVRLAQKPDFFWGRDSAMTTAKTQWQTEYAGARQDFKAYKNDKNLHSVLSTCAFSGVGKTTLLDELSHTAWTQFCEEAQIEKFGYIMVDYNGRHLLDFQNPGEFDSAHLEHPSSMLAWRLLYGAAKFESPTTLREFFERYVEKCLDFKAMQCEKVLKHIVKEIFGEQGSSGLLICVDEVVKMLASSPEKLHGSENQEKLDMVLNALSVLCSAAQACNTERTFVRVAISSLWDPIPQILATQSGRPILRLGTWLLSWEDSEKFRVKRLHERFRRAETIMLEQCCGHPKSLKLVHDYLKAVKEHEDETVVLKLGLGKLRSSFPTRPAALSSEVLTCISLRECVKVDQAELLQADGALIPLQDTEGLYSVPYAILSGWLAATEPPWSFLREALFFAENCSRVGDEKNFEEAIIKYLLFLCGLLQGKAFSIDKLFGPLAEFGSNKVKNKQYTLPPSLDFDQVEALKGESQEEFKQTFLYSKLAGEKGIEATLPLLEQKTGNSMLILLQVKWVGDSQMPTWRDKAKMAAASIQTCVGHDNFLTAYIIQRTGACGTVELEPREVLVHGPKATKAFLNLLAGSDARWQKK